jgi:hypothetical protein
VKRAIGIAVAFALVLATMPGITGDTSRAFSTMPEATRATLAPRPDDTLHAFSTMSEAQQFSLAPLSDEQLAAVRGKEMLEEGLVLMQIFNALFYTLDLTTLVSSSTSTQSTSSVSQVQQNTGGGIQMNRIDVRQQ